MIFTLPSHYGIDSHGFSSTHTEVKEMNDMKDIESPQCGSGVKNGAAAGGTCSKEADKTASGSKKVYAILAVFLVLVGGAALLIVSGLLPNPLQNLSTLAIVNGQKISATEVNRELEAYKRTYGKANRVDFTSPEGKKALEVLRKKIVEILIQKQILLTAAAEEKITVTPQEVTDKINAIKTGMKLSDQGFEDFLKKNDMNMAAYRQHIEQDSLIKKMFDRGVQKGMDRNALLIDLRSRAKIETFE
jgi:hypothetical protein